MKSLTELFQELFEPKLPVITEESTLVEIEKTYPNALPFLERKYGIKPETDDRSLSLKDLVEKFKLPPAQIIFMEVQLDSRPSPVAEWDALEAKKYLQRPADVAVLDVREDWEWRYGSLPGAQALTPVLLNEVLAKWPKNKRILVYCHFGIRSTDAATFLADRGFENVAVLKGGLDSWSQLADPTLPRYSGAYC